MAYKPPYDAQIKIFRAVWGRVRLPHGHVRYVSLATMDPERPRLSRTGNRMFNDQTSFQWPDQMEDVREYLAENMPDKEVYFTANLFKTAGRDKGKVEANRVLWADLDGADPRKGILKDWQASIAWETSPGSFQAIWILQDEYDPKRFLAEAEGLNQRLNYAVGADKGGWASNKYLRVPGSLNFKPERMAANGGNPWQGKILWDNERQWLIEEFDDLPHLSGVERSNVEHATEEMIDAVDRRSVWNRVRMRVSKLTREYMAARDDSGADRSDVLWQLEREFADAGCTLAEIVSLVRPTVWNKFDGRRNELTQLISEASKAIAERKDDGVLEFEEASEPIDEDIVWATDLQLKPRKRTSWLIKNIWPEGACGFISGIPKSYKSWFAMDAAVSVTTGQPFLDEPDWGTKKSPVLMIQEEDNEETVMDRYEQIVDGKLPHANAKGFLTYDPVTRTVTNNPPKMRPELAIQIHKGFVASDPKWHDWLEEKVEKHKFKLIVIDTLGTTIGDVDSNNSEQVNLKVLRPLKEISVKYGCAIMIVAHNKKDANSERSGQNIMGSQAFHAWSEASILIKTKHDGKMGKPSTLVATRETKADTEIDFAVDIPYMTRDDDSHREPPAGRGDRTWRPIVRLKFDDSVAKESTAQDEVSQPQGGGQMVAVIKQLGGGRGKLVLLDRIVQSLNLPKATVLKRLANEVNSKRIEGSPGEGWTLPLKLE